MTDHSEAVIQQLARTLSEGRLARLRNMLYPPGVGPPSGPTLDDILRWLSAEAEWWARARDGSRRYQTNLVWHRLTEWRDTGKEPKHGL